MQNGHGIFVLFLAIFFFTLSIHTLTHKERGKWVKMITWTLGITGSKYHINAFSICMVTWSSETSWDCVNKEKLGWNQAGKNLEELDKEFGNGKTVLILYSFLKLEETQRLAYTSNTAIKVTLNLPNAWALCGCLI